MRKLFEMDIHFFLSISNIGMYIYNLCTLLKRILIIIN